MKDFSCTKCGKPHETEAKFCYFCKTDLEEAILEYIQKHLPIKFEKKMSPQLIQKEVERRKLEKSKKPKEKYKPTNQEKIAIILNLVFVILAIVMFVLIVNIFGTEGRFILWQIILELISIIGLIVCSAYLFVKYPDKKSCLLSFRIP